MWKDKLFHNILLRSEHLQLYMKLLPVFLGCIHMTVLHNGHLSLHYVSNILLGNMNPFSTVYH
jgi:hypothetical protein